MKRDPFSSECSNPNLDDDWTCPACYNDLGNVGRGRHTCPRCDTPLDCTVEYQPACYARIAGDVEE